MAAYTDESRARIRDREMADKIIDTARKAAPYDPSTAAENGMTCSVLGPEDAEEMVNVYRTVFSTYPFPIFDPRYLRETMEDNLVYFGIRDEGKTGSHILL